MCYIVIHINILKLNDLFQDTAFQPYRPALIAEAKKKLPRLYAEQVKGTMLQETTRALQHVPLDDVRRCSKLPGGSLTIDDHVCVRGCPLQRRPLLHHKKKKAAVSASVLLNRFLR